jgi:hypothetical protein
MKDASPVERIEALGVEHGRSLVDLLRTHACKVAIEPVLVMEDDGDPDHLPIRYLDVPKLMAIWTATAVVPQVGPLAAAEFRFDERPNDADAAPVSESVRPAPVVVAPVARIERLVTR